MAKKGWEGGNKTLPKNRAVTVAKFGQGLCVLLLLNYKLKGVVVGLCVLCGKKLGGGGGIKNPLTIPIGILILILKEE